jgi:hypothetical protein
MNSNRKTAIIVGILFIISAVTGEKVDTQWKLFCLVHNIGKIARYATI